MFELGIIGDDLFYVSSWWVFPHASYYC